MNRHFAGFLLMATMLLSASMAFGGPIYVKAGGAGDGSTWANALGSIQAALDMASSTGRSVWVAGGFYDPGATLDWRSNAKAFGGFHDGDTLLSQRDIAGNPSVITGAGVRRVIWMDGLINTRIDGFTIAAGVIDGDVHWGGAGIYCNGLDSSNIIINCIVRDCVVLNNGHAGGILSNGGTGHIIENCTIQNNSTPHMGGGLFVHWSSATVRDCTFTSNTSGAAWHGGGVAVWESSATTITRCNFINNQSTGGTSGGGLFCGSNGNAAVAQCLFQGNTAGNVGGGVNIENAQPTFADCIFLNNSAPNHGGGVFAGSNIPMTLSFSRCLFQGNSVNAAGGAMGLHGWSSQPFNVTIGGSHFQANTSQVDAGALDIRNPGVSVTINGTTFRDNQAGLTAPGGQAGAIMNLEQSVLNLNRCGFFGNTTQGGGGGAIFNHVRSVLTATNCVFDNNHAPWIGGGIAVWGSSATINHCTFNRNGNGGYLAHGVWVDNSPAAASATITNSIFWGPFGPPQLGQNTPGLLNVTYSNVEGGWGGTGNMNTNPLFVSAGNPRLQAGSPCRNAANSTLTVDIFNNVRPYGGGRDMGAYEWNDTTPSVTDIAPRTGEANPTNNQFVVFNVTLNEGVGGQDYNVLNGFTPGHFNLATTGSISGASIWQVSGNTTSRTVVVNTGTGSGTIRLDMTDAAGLACSGNLGVAGVPFTTGSVFTIDKTNPRVNAITRADANPTNSASVDFSVVFSEPVSAVSPSGFDLLTTGAISGASITGLSGSGANYTVTVNTGTGDGTLGIRVGNGAAIFDSVGNMLENWIVDSELYTIDKSPPTVSQVLVQTGLTVDVVFSEAMGTGVTTASNYVISEEGKGTLSNNPDSVALVSGNRYRLTWNTGEMRIFANVVITVNNVRDVAGNLISSPNWARHTNGGIGVAPTVSGVSVTAPNTVRVTFIEAMGAGATTASNYAISGAGRGTLSATPGNVTSVDGTTYELTWASGIMLIGGAVTITVSNAQDLAGNVLGTPNSATHTGGGQAVPPNPPVVNGATPTNNPRPQWTWTPGGGGNGTYRYDLDASGTWTQTTATSFTPASDLSEGTHRLVVQERDAAGNWSADSFFDILIDLTPPNPPTVNGTTPTNNPRPQWTWTPGGGDGSGNFRYDLDNSGVWTETTATAFTPASDLSEGSHRLVVQERDAVGNWSADSFFDIFVDLTPPNPPLLSGTALTNNPRPTWTWTPGGGGNGTYRYDLDASGAWTETTAAAFTPASDLSEGTHRLVVQERDAAGNWSADSFFDVFIDLTPPNAPVVDGVTPTNNPRPTWTWTTGGGDGSANFRYDLNNSGVWTETTATAYTPASDLSAGTHRLVVQERDPAGNWSADGFFDIFVDLVAPEPPVVSGDTPTNNPRPTWTWTPGGGGNGTYRYDLDASGVWTETIATSFTPGVDLSDGLHTLAVQERNELGNWSLSGTHDILVDAAAPVAQCQDVMVYLSSPLLDAAAIDGGSTDNTGIVDWQIDGGNSVLFTCADILSNPNTVTLRVADAVGNHDECAALVTVVDDIAPVLTIPGGTTRHVLLDSAWTPPAADAEDNCDGALTAVLADDGGLDTAVLGEYTLVYAATDAAGNTGTAELTVFVEETVFYPIVVNPVGETYFVRDVGESVTFEVSVSGGSGLSPLQFQWMRITGGKAHTQIDGADWSTYTIDNIEEADGGQYLCEVFDDESEPAASPVFTLVVNEASGVPAAGAFGLLLAAAALALAGARRMRRN